MAMSYSELQSESADTVRRALSDGDVSHVMLGVVDLDGVLRAKHLSVEKVLRALDGDGRFCDVVLGFDSNDDVYENTAITGWHTGFPDVPVRIAPETLRPLVGNRRSYFLLADYGGHLEQVCPRRTLRRVLKRAEEMGFQVSAAFEYEFTLLAETPHSVREKEYRGLRPITPGAFAYSALRSSVWRELYDEIIATCEQIRAPLEALHAESGPGALEAAIKVDDALEAADRAIALKTFVKAVAQRQGLIATFMSRWSPDWPGQGGHVHVSLHDAQGASCFHDPDLPDGMTATMRHFVGGAQALLPDLCAIYAPTVNSYTRLAPGAWAPTTATWGIENRTCALRVIPGRPSSQRLEHRVPGADANPYLAMAAVVGSGLWGIEHHLKPSAPVVGNAYEQPPQDAPPLPASLGEAAARLVGSAPAAELFGRPLVEHFARSREWEEAEFRRSVTDWELQRYLEVI
jgi:glutamine synthetase